MTKEYTGPEFEVEFARAWLKYVEGGKGGVDPRTNYQSWNRYDTWRNESGMPKLVSDPDFAYRWKPAPKRMVSIGYMSGGTWLRKELVAPEVEAPPKGTTFFAAVTQVVEFRWEDDDTLCRDWLNAGLVFLTREDAQAMADWLATCRKGGQS